MSNTRLLKGEEAKTRLKAGIDMLADAVKVTLGAAGRNVVISHGGGDPHLTKDGVTVAKSIRPEDPVERAGAYMVRQAASKTANDAGDGTSTSIVLSQSLITAGLSAIKNGANPMQIKTGIEKGLSVVKDIIKTNSMQITDSKDLENIAIISANGDEKMGKLIAGVVGRVGKTGEVKVQYSKTSETTAEIVDGMVIDRGFTSPYFATNAKMEAEYENVLVAVIDFEVVKIAEIMHLMESVVNKIQQDETQGTKTALLIIARNIEGEALSTLLMNKVKHQMPFVVVKAPGFGTAITEILEDICIVTGAALISDDHGLNVKNANIDHVGICEKVIVTKDRTVLIGGHGNQAAIDNRYKMLETLVSEAKSEREASPYQRRLSAMRDGVGIVYVGGTTDVEAGEKKDRIDDAICATKAALEEGVVAGGGVTYLKCVDTIQVKNKLGSHKILTENKGEEIGIEILMHALQSPFNQIMDNAGLDTKDIYSRLSKLNYPMGYDLKSNQFVNMIEAGIIDPAKVSRVALENAVSVACAVLTSEAVSYVVEEGKA